MPYVERLPSPALRPWVECFWSRRDDTPPGAQRILPDGCADLVFDLTSGESVAVGTMTTALVLEPQSPSHYFGVRFRPGRAAAFLRIPLAELTDARVPLRDVWKHWPDQPPDAHLLEAELLRRLNPQRDRRVDGAIALIAAGGGTVRVDDIARELGISRQHLSRQFLHHVGVTPKTFARVIRFRHLVDSVLTRDTVDWADAALEHGYYDQSHLIADFRALAGTPPNAFHFSNR